MIANKGLGVLKRCISNVKLENPKICIVGAGPAGFYVAQHLTKKLQRTEIDIFERLPVPFGLVRFGVAPDHPEVKNVIHTFTKTAEMPNVNFFGNVNLGKDVSLNELRSCYHIVVLTYGAEESKTLNIPGESLNNVISAKNIVGWYNGVPSDADLKIDLTAETVGIIGQGNVAIDIARILLTPIDELKKTDITQHALDQLSQSRIKRIYLIGRRGPLQAAYTIKELREMLKLKNCSTIWRNEDFRQIGTNIIEKLPRPRKRLTELMLKSVQEQAGVAGTTKIFSPVFLRSPLEISGESKVRKLILGVNTLEGDDVLKQNAVLSNNTEAVDCDLVVLSIGYRSIQVDPTIPFDVKRGVITSSNGKIDTGLYTSGWLGTGPVGVILSTMSNAFGIAEQIIEDIQKDSILNASKPGMQEIKKILEQKKIQVVEWQDWEKINNYEINQGEKVGKPREKIVDVKMMLEIASS